MPLGRASLFTFSMHLIAIPIVFNAPGFTDEDGALGATLWSTLLVAIVYGAVLVRAAVLWTLARQPSELRIAASRLPLAGTAGLLLACTGLGVGKTEWPQITRGNRVGEINEWMFQLSEEFGTERSPVIVVELAETWDHEVDAVGDIGISPAGDRKLARAWADALLEELGPQRRQEPLAIMPLGDQIAALHYRYNLWRLLIDAELDFDFIGTQHSLPDQDGRAVAFPEYRGRTFDADHEGHDCWSSMQLVDGLEDHDEAGGLEDWLERDVPDVVLLSVGTHDLLHWDEDAWFTLDHIEEIIWILRDHNEDVMIFLQQLPPMEPDWDPWEDEEACDEQWEDQ